LNRCSPACGRSGRGTPRRCCANFIRTSFVFTPIAFEPHGDQLLIEVRANARARGSGIELEGHMAHLYTLRDGRLVRLQAFTSTAEARESLAYPERR
jgi:ketosteroid isomerase-like protein